MLQCRKGRQEENQNDISFNVLLTGSYVGQEHVAKCSSEWAMVNKYSSRLHLKRVGVCMVKAEEESNTMGKSNPI